ncbi:hypothetical protein [Flavobacterium microcysteis]
MKFFDMMYYYLATFYKRFFKKRSAWEFQAIFVVMVAQSLLIFDVAMVFYGLFVPKGKLTLLENMIMAIIIFGLLYYNIRRYEKKYLIYHEHWKHYSGITKGFFVFLTFFTVVFLWCFVFIAATIFDRYK